MQLPQSALTQRAKELHWARYLVTQSPGRLGLVRAHFSSAPCPKGRQALPQQRLSSKALLVRAVNSQPWVPRHMLNRLAQLS